MKALDANGVLQEHGPDELRRRFDQAWTKPDGAKLLDDVHAFIGRFVAYPSEDAQIAHVLWVAHAHLMDAWESTPRLAFLSPEPASGKSRALEVTETLVPRPIASVNCTSAYLFRKIDEDEHQLPTILFDEIDTVFGPKAKENEDLRGLLNAGHRRGAKVGRCVVVGKKVMTQDISAFCAVAVAGLGGLPDTIMTRSVVVRMKRRAPGQAVEPYRRRRHEKVGHIIRDRLAQWAAGAVQSVTGAEPDMPDGVEDRAADVWEPLLAVADAIGGQWPKLARDAAVTLVTESRRSSPSLGVRLLSDIRDVFGSHPAMATTAILEKLRKINESPWATIQKGKEINAHGLGRRLEPYGIASRQLRRYDGSQYRGYERAQFEDAWRRYLASPPPDNSVASVTSVTNPYAAARNGASGVTDVTDVTELREARETDDPDDDWEAA